MADKCNLSEFNGKSASRMLGRSQEMEPKGSKLSNGNNVTHGKGKLSSGINNAIGKSKASKNCSKAKAKGQVKQRGTKGKESEESISNISDDDFKSMRRTRTGSKAKAAASLKARKAQESKSSSIEVMRKNRKWKSFKGKRRIIDSKSYEDSGEFSKLIKSTSYEKALFDNKSELKKSKGKSKGHRKSSSEE